MNSSSSIVSILFILAICVGIFLLCREIMCWYFKINKLIEGQTQTNILLKRILDKLTDNIKTNAPPENIQS
jgi:hypothetical protein